MDQRACTHTKPGYNLNFHLPHSSYPSLLIPPSTRLKDITFRIQSCRPQLQPKTLLRALPSFSAPLERLVNLFFRSWLAKLLLIRPSTRLLVGAPFSTPTVLSHVQYHEVLVDFEKNYNNDDTETAKLSSSLPSAPKAVFITMGTTRAAAGGMADLRKSTVATSFPLLKPFAPSANTTNVVLLKWRRVTPPPSSLTSNLKGSPKKGWLTSMRKRLL